jgi:hypothetical protein
MLFGLIYSPSKLYNKPHLLFLEAVFLTIVSVFLSLFIFPNQYLSFGILMFLTIGAVPLFTKLFSYNSYLSNYQKPFLKRHSSLLKALAYFFIGVFVSFIVFFFLFSLNYDLEIYNVNEKITIVDTGVSEYFFLVTNINENNIQVSLYQNNTELQKNLFSKGQYVDFRGYEFNKTFLITDFSEDVTFSVGNGIRENIFFVQLKERSGLESLRGQLTGQVIGTTPKASFKDVFSLIFINNFNVAIKAIVMSFFYGAGALFLISWNASVLAGVVALDIFVSMAPLVSQGFKGLVIGVFQSLVLFVGYLPHGLPELLAYFFVSFAGAVLARDFFKGMFFSEFRLRVIKDLLLIFLFALLLLFLGAIIEATYFI